jgi:hypothetical protein
MSQTWVLAALAVVAAPIACGGGRPAETPLGPSQGAPVAAIATTPAPIASTSNVPPPSEPSSGPAAPPEPLPAVLTTDTSTVEMLFDRTSHAPAAALREKGTAAADPLAKALRELAKRAAPGMEPDGPLATGTLKEKQNLQTDITLQPGKCYAIVGYSKAVKDLDLYLLLAPGILSGQDTTDDNRPVIGGPPQPMCPVATTPVTYKLGIVADQGTGEIAVQLYSKAK